MAFFGPDKPITRDYGTELYRTSLVQRALMPGDYAAEAEWGPKYAQLNLDILNQTLPGIMGAYASAQPQLSAIENATQNAKVANELGLLQKYGTTATNALREASGSKTLVDMLNQQAQDELAAGSTLDPQTQRAYEQSMRSAQAGRGMMLSGAPAISAEAALGAQQAEAMRRRRQQFAQSVVAMDQSTGGDPLMTILGRPSQAFGAMPAYGQQAQQLDPGNLFNPESPYAGNVYAANQAYDWQYKQTQPSGIAKIGMVASMLGQIAGAVAGGAAGGGSMGGVMGGISKGMCWVAREVYGDGDVRWLWFRQWLLTRAPSWFRELYRENGERFANWIHNKPVLKRMIRRWMDGRIASLA